VSQLLVVVVTLASAVVVGLGVASTLVRRRIGLLHLVTTAVLEALLLVQAAFAVAGLVGGRRLGETGTFAGYLVTIVLIPVAGALFARSETSRWAGTVLAVAAAVAAVMAWRLLQLWEAPVA
jgi:hypothetical protein